MRLLVGSAHRVVREDCPVVRAPGRERRSVVGWPLPLDWTGERAEALLPAPQGNSATRTAYMPDRGVREKTRCCCRLPRGSGRRMGSVCRGYSVVAGHNRTGQNAQGETTGDHAADADSDGAHGGGATARQPNFSQLKLSEKQAKAIHLQQSLQNLCKAVVNAFREYEGLHSLATAKLERRANKIALASPPSYVNTR